MSETDDLENLLKSPGWLWLLEYARAEWAEGYARKIKLAIVDAKQRGADVSAAVEAVDAANDAVNALLSRPRERLKQLAEATAQAHRPESLSRRGGL